MSMTANGTVPRYLLFFALLFCLLPAQVFACACGCGMFDVSTGSVLPNGPGGTVWLETDYMKQNHNQEGHSSASDTLNEDKKIRTTYYQAGAQYIFNRNWGARAVIPYVDRNFVTTDDVTGDLGSFNQRGLGDIRLTGIYTGLSPNMDSGLTLGVKLPTGDFHEEGFDRDTAIGTGSTDVLVGGYHLGRFANPVYGWFANAVLDQPVLTRDSYRPGTEINGVVGAYHEGWTVGKAKITPVLQVIGAHKWHDSGAEADPDETGYTRFLASPGIELAVDNTRLYTDIAVPFYEKVKGDQLVAPVLAKVVLSYDF